MQLNILTIKVIYIYFMNTNIMHPDCKLTAINLLTCTHSVSRGLAAVWEELR